MARFHASFKYALPTTPSIALGQCPLCLPPIASQNRLWQGSYEWHSLGTVVSSRTVLR